MEQFTEGWESRWIPSQAKKEDSQSEDEWAFVGKWAVEEPSVFKGMEGDKGLVVKDVAAHHAISAKFPKKIDNKGKTLVVQYEVKPQSTCLPAIAYSPEEANMAALIRLSGLRWCLLEAPPGEQEAPR